MWRIRVEAKGYNTIYFQFESLTSALTFIETAQAHCEEKLEITIRKIDETEGEQE